MAIRYNKTSGKIIPHKFKLEEIEEADSLYQGFCIACRAIRDCCEPDARRYPCDECGKRHVYGAAELAIMGLVRT